MPEMQFAEKEKNAICICKHGKETLRLKAGKRLRILLYGPIENILDIVLENDAILDIQVQIQSLKLNEE